MWHARALKRQLSCRALEIPRNAVLQANRPRSTLIVAQDRADAPVLDERRIAAEPEQVEVEGLTRLLLVVPFDLDRDWSDRSRQKV